MIGLTAVPEIPAASDVFLGATCQIEIDARIGDFIALLEDHGIVVARGIAAYAPGYEPPVRLEGWTFTKVRADHRRIAVARVTGGSP